MCGRYLVQNPAALRELARRLFGAHLPDFAPRYNVAPSQSMPVIATAEDGSVRAATMKWGMVPFWDKSERPRLAPINAKAEEAFSKPMFRQSIQKRRCLVPADGFYEWQKLEGDRKQPFVIHLKGDLPFFFAGIYESATEIRPETFLVFTTNPNALMARIHNRMPVILPDEMAKHWIAPGPVTADELAGFTASYPAAGMEARPISLLVNNPRNDSPEILVDPDEFRTGVRRA
ncbi:MAG TPA: SOS response-associated peptidase [Opitutaceae bacterium]|nr:SOS response-associated peptidase [Opitutaceae bacterium]